MGVSGIGSYSGGVTDAERKPYAPQTREAGNDPRSTPTPEQEREIDRLKKRDAEVRQHEQAHVAAAGRYARGGPNYEFTVGPDGKRYATGGNVQLDTGPERTPQATIDKAEVVRRAALAPSDPSPQDRRVASAASQMERKARAELAKEKSEEKSEAPPLGGASGKSQRDAGDEVGRGFSVLA